MIKEKIDNNFSIYKKYDSLVRCYRDKCYILINLFKEVS